MATTNDIHDAKESTGATEICFAEKVTLDTLPNYLRENSIEINSVAIYPSFLSFEFVICFNKLGNQLRIALPGSEDNYNLIKNQYQSDYDTINDKKIKNLQTTWAICNLIEYIHDSLNVNKITLTHMLPSWTNYGQSIIDHFETNNDNHNNNNSNVNYLKQCEITTSHNTTLACVVYNVEFVLNYYDRRLKSEIVGILGCGSIGYNSTLLLFSYFNENDYPIKLLLCDIETRKERIIKLKNEIVNLFNYKSDQIEIVVNRNGNVNKIFYQSSLIIGATSKGNVLDAWKLRPNTMVIDDSEPHCVHVQQVIKRFKSQNDIILTEAGVVSVRGNVKYIIGKPTGLGTKKFWQKYFEDRQGRIFSCTLGGMLLAKYPNNVSCLIGEPTYNEGLKRIKLMKECGIQGTLYISDHNPKPQEKDMGVEYMDYDKFAGFEHKCCVDESTIVNGNMHKRIHVKNESDHDVCDYNCAVL